MLSPVKLLVELLLLLVNTTGNSVDTVIGRCDRLMNKLIQILELPNNGIAYIDIQGTLSEYESIKGILILDQKQRAEQVDIDFINSLFESLPSLDQRTSSANLVIQECKSRIANATTELDSSEKFLITPSQAYSLYILINNKLWATKLD